MVKPSSKPAAGAQSIARLTVASAAKVKGKPDGPANPLALLSPRAVRWLSIVTLNVSSPTPRRKKGITAPAGKQPKCIRKQIEDAHSSTTMPAEEEPVKVIAPDVLKIPVANLQ